MISLSGYGQLNYNPDKTIIYRNIPSVLIISDTIQEQSEKHRNRNNFLYFELAGAAFGYTFNYERILLSTKNKSTNFKFLIRSGFHLISEGGILLGFSGLVGNKKKLFRIGWRRKISYI